MTCGMIVDAVYVALGHITWTISGRTIKDEAQVGAQEHMDCWVLCVSATADGGVGQQQKHDCGCSA
jgi:hypothetical protein